MLSRETFISMVKFEQAIGNNISGSKPGASIRVKVQKIKHPDGNWNYKIGDSEIPKEVKKGLGDIIGALQKRELKTDVLIKENK